MNKVIWFAAYSALFALVPIRDDQDASNADRVRFQGRWELEDKASSRSLEVKGDVFTFRSDGKVTRQVTGTLHATKLPKAIDLKEDSEPSPFLAIYKFDKEHVTLCIAVEKARPTNTRPTAFEAKPGQVLATYTRVKQ